MLLEHVYCVSKRFHLAKKWSKYSNTDFPHKVQIQSVLPPSFMDLFLRTELTIICGNPHKFAETSVFGCFFSFYRSNE